MAAREANADENKKKLKWFQEQILPLDFFKEIFDDRQTKKSLAEVPLGFENERHYMDTYVPLLMEEVKMQIHRSKDTDMPLVPTEEVALSLHSDEKQKQDNSFRVNLKRRGTVAGRKKKEDIKYSTGDLILISQSKDWKEDLEKATAGAEESALHMLGWLENSAFGELRALVMPGDLKTKDKESRPYKILEAIAACKPWYVTYVFSMNTCVREFEGLMALPRIPLRNLLVNNHVYSAATKGKSEGQVPSAGITEDEGVGSAASTYAIPDAVKEDPNQVLAIPKKIEELFASKYNAMQLKAIRECRKVAGITLIQGPPGTGKTTTILGILSMLLNAKSSIPKVKRIVSEMEEENEEEELESEETIRERKRQRVDLLRQRAPWLRVGYIPWADTIEKQLPTRNINVPYPKISSRNVVQMYTDENERDQKVLVCAPSNAAIDEVLRRSIQEGIVDEDGIPRKPSIVRVGPNVHKDMLSYGLNEQAAKNAGFQAAEKEEEKARIMRAVRIVCATLSTSGSRDVAGASEEFDTVVIDEASQGVEMSTLVPLKLGCRRLILVGDPKQLTATVFSSVALAHKYDQSLFQRLAASGYLVTMLDEQFRMHPAISAFPSKQFYEGRLKDGRDKDEFERNFPAEWSKINCFGHAVFFHLQGSTQTSLQSFVNPIEAKFVVNLYAALAHVYPPEEKWRSRFAIISPYRGQVQLLRTEFSNRFGFTRENFPIDINTVDGFQGREKDIVIVSTVRAAVDDSIGFVAEKRRMNVAFTRARTNLWVVGHAAALQQSPDWNAFVTMQQEKCAFMRVSVPHETFFGRYLNGWYDRHPECERPDLSSLLDESNIPAIGDTGDAVEISDAECPDINVSRLRDVELLSDDDFEEVHAEDPGVEHHGLPEGETVVETVGDAQAPDDSKDDEDGVADE